MGAVGGRGILLSALENGGFELATRTDAMLTRLSSDAVAGLAVVDADAHRVRLVLEGSRPVLWPEGQSVTPAVELGVRHDWGDAETGFGLELGGRVQYADPTLGLTLDAAVRGLLAPRRPRLRRMGCQRHPPDRPGSGRPGSLPGRHPDLGRSRKRRGRPVVPADDRGPGTPGPGRRPRPAG